MEILRDTEKLLFLKDTEIMKLNTEILYGSMMSLSNHNGAYMLSIMKLKLQGKKKKRATTRAINFGWKKLG